MFHPQGAQKFPMVRKDAKIGIYFRKATSRVDAVRMQGDFKKEYNFFSEPKKVLLRVLLIYILLQKR